MVADKTKVIKYEYKKLSRFPNYKTLSINLVIINQKQGKNLDKYLGELSFTQPYNIGFYSRNPLDTNFLRFMADFFRWRKVHNISLCSPDATEKQKIFVVEEIIKEASVIESENAEDIIEFLVLHSWLSLEGQEEIGIYYYDIPRTLLVFVQDEQDAKDVEKALDNMVDEETKKYQKHNIVK